VTQWDHGRRSRVSESHVESDVTKGREIDHVESSLQKLWEKARRLSEFLLRLKEENQALRRRLDDLERRERQLTEELKSREQEMLKLQSNGSGMFTHEEKEALAGKIRELIAKLNARL
jgi:predicted  nucleic acid-binding Zn-ribbon protein